MIVTTNILRMRCVRRDDNDALHGNQPVSVFVPVINSARRREQTPTKR